MKFQGLSVKASDFIWNILKAGRHQNRARLEKTHLSWVCLFEAKARGKIPSSFWTVGPGRISLQKKILGFSNISSLKSFEGTLKNR
jgi:hypothetical protein